MENQENFGRCQYCCGSTRNSLQANGYAWKYHGHCDCQQAAICDQRFKDQQGQLDEAIRQYRDGLRLKPDDADAHYNLAVFYLEEKPPAIELARRHYYRAIELGAEKDAAIEKVLKTDAPKQ